MASCSERTALRYLDAANVEHRAGTLAGLEVQGPHGEHLGAINGVLVEPRQRRVRYFVVERSALLRRKRYLVPVDCVATLHPDDGTIYMDVNDDVIERFDSSSIPEFSGEDAVDAMFASSAA